MTTKKELEKMKQEVIDFHVDRINRVYASSPEKAEYEIEKYSGIQWTPKKIKQWWSDLPQNKIIDKTSHDYNVANFENPKPLTESEMQTLKENSYVRIYA